jgi:ABC-2 type transport system ATP-binding protein
MELAGVTKRYGARYAVRDVSFSVEPGERVAVIGPNGAGKTTLLRILAGSLKPDSGTVRIPGRVGWVPQQTALYGKLSVAENLRLFARLEGVGDVEGVVDRMLSQTALAARADDAVASLSGGNRQRVNVAIGLLGDPDILLLDEPTTALDPRQRERVWEFLSTLPATILYSTHVLPEAEHHASRIVVIDEGRVVHDGVPVEDMELAFLGWVA